MIKLAKAAVFAALTTAVLFSFSSLPIYIVATAHAGDFAEPIERVELTTTLKFPLRMAQLRDRFPPAASNTPIDRKVFPHRTQQATRPN